MLTRMRLGVSWGKSKDPSRNTAIKVWVTPFRSPMNIFFAKGSSDQLVWRKRCGGIGVALPAYHYIRVIR
jgi:hypothetical protein